VPVFHFHRETHISHGLPFLYLLKKGETLRQTRENIRNLLEIPEAEFEKFKFAIVAYRQPKYLKNEGCDLPY